MAQDLVRSFRKIMQASNKKPSGYETTATVVRVDKETNTAWVHIDGGVDQTPAAMAVNCKKGDTIRLRISGKSASVSGNLTAPPTDDAKAIAVEKRMESGEFNGEKGDPGTPGENGADAVDILKVVTEFCLANGDGTHDFDTLEHTTWSEELPEPQTGWFYWRRTVTYFVDGTVAYGDPVYDLTSQAIYDAQRITNTASQAASQAQEAASQAGQNAQAASASAAQAARDAQIVNGQMNHFWYDNSTGAHVSHGEGSIASGAAVNATATALTFTKDAKLLGSLSGNGLNFYDGTGSATPENDLVASYNRDGAIFYAKQTNASVSYKTMSITKGDLTFWDPTDSSSNQRMRALFSNSSSNFYSSGKLVSSFGANALNFYDGAGSSNAVNDLLASYNRDGMVLYGKASSTSVPIKIATFGRSSVTFWDTTGQNARAVFGSSGISFGTDVNFTIGDSTGNYIKWDSSQNKILINAGTIQIGGKNYFSSYSTNGLFIHSANSSSSPTGSNAYGVNINGGISIVSGGYRTAVMNNTGLYVNDGYGNIGTEIRSSYSKFHKPTTFYDSVTFGSTTSPFKIVSVELTTSASKTGPNSTGPVETTVSEAGYYPLGIVGGKTGNGDYVISRLDMGTPTLNTSTGNYTAVVTYNVRAVGIGANVVWITTPTANVLFMKYEIPPMQDTELPAW